MTPIAPPDEAQITGVILAGGRSSRMGEDKAWSLFRGKPMIEWVRQRVQPQVSTLLVSVSGDSERYRALDLPLLADGGPAYQGPLSGITTALSAMPTEWLLVVPCDTPQLPADLVSRLAAELVEQQALLAVAHDGARRQNLCLLLHKNALPGVERCLRQGENSVHGWLEAAGAVEVDFSDCPEAFLNCNRPEDLQV